MNAKMMEGLVGAKANVDLINTPFRVYKEAERRGDTATMERAMGYVNDFTYRAEEYAEKAEEGTIEDAEAAREKEEQERELAIEKRREENEELEDRIKESKEENTVSDTVEISQDGQLMLKENGGIGTGDSDGIAPKGTVSVKTTDAPDMKPVIYTKTGEASQPKPSGGTPVINSLL